jgi:hypothetical protein
MAQARSRVIVCGDSLILAGMQVQLGTYHRLEVIHIDILDDRLEQTLTDLKPDALLFDLGDPLPVLPVSLLLSNLVLIGIDLETSQAIVWSGSQRAALATSDLVNLICALGCVGQSRHPQPAIVG